MEVSRIDPGDYVRIRLLRMKTAVRPVEKKHIAGEGPVPVFLFDSSSQNLIEQKGPGGRQIKAALFAPRFRPPKQSQGLSQVWPS